jgi:hypothetical protein
VVENTIYRDNRNYLKNSGLSSKIEKTTSELKLKMS